MDLVEKSLEVIINNQSKSGAFIASPSFDTYAFSWLRDGSFIANSLDQYKKYDEAEKFYRWVNDVINRYSDKVNVIEDKISRGERISRKDYLNARFTLEGFEEKKEGWGNFQLDGYGTWLWAVSEHIKLTGKTELIDEFHNSINAALKYIKLLAFYPNYDIWEENYDKIHTSTLACLYGGVKAINDYLKKDEVTKLANQIKTYILTNCVEDEHFVKFIGTKEIDSSLLWLAIPFNVVDVSDDIFKNTVKKIEDDLFVDNGMHRYKKDTYYGGGEWILLSAWMGLYYKKVNETEKAEAVEKWIEKYATEEGYLPEQVCLHPNDETYYPKWVDMWGEIASPLLWSHAMYLILKSK